MAAGKAREAFGVSRTMGTLQQACPGEGREGMQRIRHAPDTFYGAITGG